MHTDKVEFSDIDQCQQRTYSHQIYYYIQFTFCLLFFTLFTLPIVYAYLISCIGYLCVSSEGISTLIFTNPIC